MNDAPVLTIDRDGVAYWTGDWSEGGPFTVNDLRERG